MKKMKYRSIKDFSKYAGISRAGAFKALERNDVKTWGQYVAFLEERDKRQMTEVDKLKARASNASKVSITAALVAAQ